MHDSRKQAEKTGPHANKRNGHAGKNGYLNVVSPATATQIRQSLGITAAQTRRVIRILKAAGVEV